MSDPGDEMFDHAGYPPGFGRPEGSNADEWHLYLSENKDALGMVAVGIAEAIEAAEARMWTRFVRVCETVEDEAAPHSSKDFYRGRGSAAKWIRRSIVHPKYAR